MNKPICDSCIFWFPDTSQCIRITLDDGAGKREECEYWTAIKENRGMNEWISVDERLPEYEYTNGIDVHKFVFVHSKQYGVVEAQFRGVTRLEKKLSWAMIVKNGGKYFYDATHWQPKAYPKPPEVETQKPGSTPGQHCHNCGEYKTTQGGWCAFNGDGFGPFGWCEDWKAKEPETIRIGEILIDTSNTETMLKIKRLINIALETRWSC